MAFSRLERCVDRGNSQTSLGGSSLGSGSHNTVNNSTNSVLSAFKAKYSQSVVGYGAENCSWSFLLSVPHLVMVSNLQSLFGVGGGVGGSGGLANGANGKLRPSIQPNDYMDGVIANMREDMKER